MISLKCKICSGELVFKDDHTLSCPYCGNQFVMTGSEMNEYGRRRQEILACLTADARENERKQLLDRIWQKAEPLSFRAASGEPVSVSCLYEGTDGGLRLLTAKTSLLILYPAGRAGEAKAFNERLTLLDFPRTDNSRLQSSFPQPGQTIPLDDGAVALAVPKQESWFPLAMFGALLPEHAAWVVSRLENICCVLEFSHLCHGGITAENVLINPWTHEAALLGGWHGAKPGSPRDDLVAMRKMILRLLGRYAPLAPAAFMRFLRGAPADNAYDDFANWDQVIETGFGGRRFAQMNIDNIL